MKIILILFFALVTLGSFAQNSFNYSSDFKKVLARTKDPENILSYDKLFKRYWANDTTLQDFEVLALMIGFTDKPQYKPYQDISIEREIYKLNGEGKFKESLDSGLKFINTHPLCVKTLFEIAYSYHKIGKEDSVQFYIYKGRRIFKAMLFSGLGKDPETPTFALGPADGQDYIRKFVGAGIGTMGSGRDKEGNFLDILEAKFDDGTSMKLYFIIEHATEKMFSEEDKKRMEEAFKEMNGKKKKKDKKENDK
jgi:hypothetical protein